MRLIDAGVFTEYDCQVNRTLCAFIHAADGRAGEIHDCFEPLIEDTYLGIILSSESLEESLTKGWRSVCCADVFSILIEAKGIRASSQEPERLGWAVFNENAKQWVNIYAVLGCKPKKAFPSDLANDIDDSRGLLSLVLSTCDLGPSPFPVSPRDAVIHADANNEILNGTQRWNFGLDLT
jgi:hypothetical protein